MANTHLDMRKIKQLYRLHTQGVSKRSISKQLGISRNTVRKYIELLLKSKLTSEEVDKLGFEDLRILLHIDETHITTRHEYVFKLYPEVSKRLKKVGVTRYMIWEDYYQNKKVFISYSRFCHLYRVWSRTQNPVMRFNHKAGDKMFVDFTGKKLAIIDPATGLLKEMEVFIAVLGASGYTYVEACRSQKREDFIGCIVGALHFFGGVPRAIVTDNLKSAVTKSSKYEPILNESLLAMATHYDTTILPTRTYRPRDKALVENAVKIIYTRVFAPLNGNDYYTLSALNEAVLELTGKHNKINFQARDCSRLDLFTSLEQEELLPLPTDKYQLRAYLMGTVYKTSHIHINKDKHYYSVPYRYIGKKVRIIYTKDTVEIYYKQKRIAVHKRGLKRHGYTTDSEHMPSTHRYVADWNPDTFLNWAEGIGGHCKTFITLLLGKRQHPEQSYKSCAGVLGLAKKVGNERLDNACKRALDYERINYQSVKSILEKGLDFIQEDTNTESTIPKHGNIRGGDYYK
ncbi:IS21 family transposase [Galbibacter orientalis]|uniref:IS21 family transposase n=1 Tax=Galbibacter orientalis TaxID=453852 RepID=UPI003080959F